MPQWLYLKCEGHLYGFGYYFHKVWNLWRGYLVCRCNFSVSIAMFLVYNHGIFSSDTCHVARSDLSSWLSDCGSIHKTWVRFPAKEEKLLSVAVCLRHPWPLLMTYRQMDSSPINSFNPFLYFMHSLVGITIARKLANMHRICQKKKKSEISCDNGIWFVLNHLSSTGLIWFRAR